MGGLHFNIQCGKASATEQKAVEAARLTNGHNFIEEKEKKYEIRRRTKRG